MIYPTTKYTKTFLESILIIDQPTLNIFREKEYFQRSVGHLYCQTAQIRGRLLWSQCVSQRSCFGDLSPKAMTLGAVA